MTDKELRKLRRSELLDMLIVQTEENKKLREELDAANRALESRAIAVEEAGTLAEASARISGIFESAERTAKLYLENIERRDRETEERCQQKLAEAKRRAEEIVAGATQSAGNHKKSNKKSNAGKHGKTGEPDQ